MKIIDKTTTNLLAHTVSGDYDTYEGWKEQLIDDEKSIDDCIISGHEAGEDGLVWTDEEAFAQDVLCCCNKRGEWQVDTYVDGQVEVDDGVDAATGIHRVHLEDGFAPRQREPTVSAFGSAIGMGFGDDADDLAVHVTRTVRRIERIRLVRRHQDTDDVRLVGVKRDGARKTCILQIFSGSIDQPVLIADVLRLVITDLFVLERLRQRGLPRSDTSDEQQLFHQVFVRGQMAKPSLFSA